MVKTDVDKVGGVTVEGARAPDAVIIVSVMLPATSKSSTYTSTKRIPLGVFNLNKYSQKYLELLWSTPLAAIRETITMALV